MSVGTGGSDQSGETASRTSSAASSAGEAARATASAASTSEVTPAWSVAVPVTEPVSTPSALRTNEITVTSMPCMTPLVVRVLLAQRRLALVLSCTITMQSSAIEVASACSTKDWGASVISVASLGDGVEDADPAEERGRAAVADRGHLPRLRLAAVEGTAQDPGVRA